MCKNLLTSDTESPQSLYTGSHRESTESPQTVHRESTESPQSLHRVSTKDLHGLPQRVHRESTESSQSPIESHRESTGSHKKTRSGKKKKCFFVYLKLRIRLCSILYATLWDSVDSLWALCGLSVSLRV
jgi:hypothetical protein